ncbi:haloacid dehalogenase domain-containing protein hydrolase [Stutzerimonas degradans]|nr:haloacid dehalogenase domain-containing protein hydrolase [Stutzerimonas degradans]
MNRKIALITDVDNTLYDWFDIWHSCFTAMLEQTIEISGVQREVLLSDFQQVFRKHRTSEYSFVLEESKVLNDLFGDEVRERLDPAIQAFRLARHESLKLYSGVKEGLKRLKDNDVKIIAYTESLQYYTLARLKALEIDSLIDALYSPPDSESKLIELKSKRIDSPLRVRTIPKDEFKPNPHILRTILEENELEPDQCLYLGDSEMKDIQMANDVGMFSVLASYGALHFESRPDDYNLLRAVSHWSDEDILREKTLKETKLHAQPDYVAESFVDVLPFFIGCDE